MSNSSYVLIVDDHPDARNILRSTLSVLGVDVQLVANGREAMEAINLQHPALILLDLMMPGMNGFELLFHLRTNPNTRNIPVIIVSAYVGEIELPELNGLEVVAKGNFRVSDMQEAVTAVLGGATPTQRRIDNDTMHVSESLSSRDALAKAIVEMLSEREREVLTLMASGLTNQEIADRLIVSANTIKTHIQHIFDKMNVSNRVEAINHATSLGLLG